MPAISWQKRMLVDSEAPLYEVRAIQANLAHPRVSPAPLGSGGESAGGSALRGWGTGNTSRVELLNPPVVPGGCRLDFRYQWAS